MHIEPYGSVYKQLVAMSASAPIPGMSAAGQSRIEKLLTAYSERFAGVSGIGQSGAVHAYPPLGRGFPGPVGLAHGRQSMHDNALERMTIERRRIGCGRGGRPCGDCGLGGPRGPVVISNE